VICTKGTLKLPDTVQQKFILCIEFLNLCIVEVYKALKVRDLNTGHV